LSIIQRTSSWVLCYDYLSTLTNCDFCVL